MLAKQLKILKRIVKSTRPDLDGCLLWTKKLDNAGYARMKVNDRMQFVHRVSFELFYGKIPDGLEIDHTCHTKDCPNTRGCKHRRCLNPVHLEAVPRQQNIARSKQPDLYRNRTHCINGHALDSANVYLFKTPRFIRRICRKCCAVRTRKYNAKRHNQICTSSTN